MALTEFKIAPGLDKQNTSVGANARWVDSDNVRFRYGLPEKVGGWRSPTTDTIVGMSRKLFPFADLLGNKYIAIGTDKFLLLYFEGQYYDITPLDTDRTQLLTAEITTTRTTYSFTFEAVEFGDPQARVLFDLGAAAGQVNLDNVSLVLN